MNFIDMHCDTLLMLLLTDSKKMDLYRTSGTMVDFERMQRGGQLAQFFAVFLPFEGAYERFGVKPLTDEEYIQKLCECLHRNVETHSDIIEMAYSADDLIENHKNGKMSAVLTMEDGRAVEGEMENIQKFYNMGFRAISLTWNTPNCFGAPNSSDSEIMKRGLTDFGKQAVRYMQDLGILVDVSHLSEGGFYDVADICQKPFIATHSNSFALSSHPRNLTDDQIRRIGDVGGVIGLNFGPEFLNKDVTCKKSTADLIAKHARYIADMGGTECIGIGSDFDGIIGDLEINDCSKIDLLYHALKRENFAESEIEKIFYVNVIRVMKDAMK